MWIIWSAFIKAFTAYKRSITLSPALLVRHYDGSSILRALSSDPLFLTVFSVYFNLKHPFLPDTLIHQNSRMLLGMSWFPVSHRHPPALRGTRLKDPRLARFFQSLPPSFLPWGGRLIVWLFKSAMVKTQQIHLPGSIKVVGATSTASHKAVHLSFRQSGGGGRGWALMREPEGIVRLTEWARVTTQYGKNIKNGSEHSWGTLFILEWRRFICIWVKIMIVIFWRLEIWHGPFFIPLITCHWQSFA